MSRSELLSKYVKLLVQLTLHFVLRKYNKWNKKNKKQIATSTTIVPEQPVIIKRICAVQISSNLQFSVRVLKFGTLFLF